MLVFWWNAAYASQFTAEQTASSSGWKNSKCGQLGIQEKRTGTYQDISSTFQDG